MQKKQSTIRKAKIIGMLLMYLEKWTEKRNYKYSLHLLVHTARTSLRTMAKRQQTAEHQLLGNGRGSSGGISEPGIRILVGPEVSRALKGYSIRVRVERIGLREAKTFALLTCS